MPTSVRCPSCAHPFRVADDAAGRRVDCPHCRKPVPVPAGPESAGPETVRLLGSIRTACWTAAGALLAFLILAVLVVVWGVFQAISRPSF